MAYGTLFKHQNKNSTFFVGIHTLQKRRLTEMWQRRRLHLRAGFDKLCQVLPGPNVKKSKNQILDRGE
jgi:hypothetical protein